MALSIPMLTMAVGIPVPDPTLQHLNTIAPDGITIKSASTGFVNATDRDTNIIGRHVPEECFFFQGSYAWVQYIFGNDHTACFGWNVDNNCADKAWEDAQYDDMLNAGLGQSAKDGWLTSTTVGKWKAHFMWSTTAVHDRKSFQVVLEWTFLVRSTFTDNDHSGLGFIEKQWAEWYYSLDGDFMYWARDRTLIGSCA
jgi:hypothetical protein